MTIERKIENVRITAAERMPNSRVGNPRWRLRTDKGTFVTEADSSINYSIANLSNSRHPETFAIGDDAEPVTLLVSGATRVFGIVRDGVALR